MKDTRKAVKIDPEIAEKLREVAKQLGYAGLSGLFKAFWETPKEVAEQVEKVKNRIGGSRGS